MSTGNSFERRIGVKIILLLTIIVLYVVGIFIYSYNLKRNIDSQKEEIVDSYKALSKSNQLISSLQEAQEISNAYLFAPQKILQLTYDSISSSISHQISEIKKLELPINQEVYLESIDSLLYEKNRIINLLIVQLRTQSPLKEFDEKIETYDKLIQDTVVVTTHKDTTVVVKETKGFWNRLKNLVNPKVEADTIITVSKEQQETHLASRMDSTLYADLKSTAKAATKTYSTQISGIERQVRELILAEQNISLQISQVLTKFYNETIRITQQGMLNSESLTQKIFRFAVLVGALSLLVILIIILFIISDLNKGQKARLDLAQEKQLTESLMESRHKLLLSVSHDIKTPLSSMIGYLDMWESEKLLENRKRQLQSAQNSGKHILSMLNNLLEFSRLEQNTAELHNSRFDVIELTEEIIRMFKPLVEGKKLALEFENLTKSPFFVETDYTVLKQILTNVISNAVKYTIKGKIDIRISYDKNLVFSVIDTGIGMDESDIPNVFKAFSRIKNPLKAEGSGFGMYVTHGLIHALGGEIQIQSKKNEGTRVSIQLPLHPVEREDDESENRSLVKEKNYSKVLVFEDDITLGNLVKEFLVQNGFEVDVCSNTNDTAHFINRVSLYDIVFTDMQMMNITGNEVLRKIRAINPDIPVWLLTAHDDYTTEKALAEGFSGLIKKPIQMGRFIDILSPGNHVVLKDVSSFNAKFPELVSMFGEDTETIKSVLSTFVASARKDTENLMELTRASDFKAAQQLCHKMHPFLRQIGANHLCDALIKMDSLRGEEETAYPNWKEETLQTIKEIRAFADAVEKEFLA